MRRMSSSIDALINKAVRPRLEALGFKKRRGGVFTIVLTPGLLGWLGLNRATEHLAAGHVEINPVVGLHFDELERLFHSCRADESSPWIAATISSPIGYLLPEKKFTTWLLGPQADPHASKGMVQAILDYGVPFMRSVPDLGTLRQKMDERRGDDILMYKRPLAAYLDGESGRARELLDASLATVGARGDLFAKDFRAFAVRLKERLG